MHRHTLGQLRALLGAIDPSVYRSINPKGNASIGQHVRHTVEFYQCLVHAEEVVNYDLRKRDLQMEVDPESALGAIDAVLDSLQSVQEDRSMLLRTGTEEDSVSEFPTSLSRELFYVLEHAIHHMALIRILLLDAKSDFPLEEDFGVAYSTSAYREGTAKG